MNEAVVSAQPALTAAPTLDGIHPPDPFLLVIFGATGDLASRMLFPALFELWRRSYLPADFLILGVGRREKSDQDFREDVAHAIARRLGRKAEEQAAFLAHVAYARLDIDKTEGFAGLRQHLERREMEHRLPGNRVFYLAIRPEQITEVLTGLESAALACRDVERPYVRVVVEKPFGHDLASAQELDRKLLLCLRPDQVFRIDHYLGKETVQNLMAFRFGNALFEPLFTRQFVEQVEITVAETVGMEGRGAYYDQAGALRDMVQNHMLQLLALVAMDPPATLKSVDLSDAKLRVFHSLRPIEGELVKRLVIRGQYGPGLLAGTPLPGYRQEEEVATDSQTETFIALRCAVENWRWAGVPFLLRTGKRLPKRLTEIAVRFRLPPLQLFRTVECEGDVCDLTEAKPSVLVFRIQPDEGISLSFATKRPGMQFVLEPVNFEFKYDRSFGQALPDAYERLLFDVLRGDASLFMRSDEMEAAWAFVTPILEAWKSQPPSFPSYAAGTWGPSEVDRLTEGLSSGWRRL